MFCSEHWSKGCAKYLGTTKENKELPIWAVRETLTAVVACELRGARVTPGRCVEEGAAAAEVEVGELACVKKDHHAV